MVRSTRLFAGMFVLALVASACVPSSLAEVRHMANTAREAPEALRTIDRLTSGPTSMAGTYEVSIQTPDGVYAFVTRTMDRPSAAIVDMREGHRRGGEMEPGFMLMAITARDLDHLPADPTGFDETTASNGMFVMHEGVPSDDGSETFRGSFNFTVPPSDGPELDGLRDLVGGVSPDEEDGERPMADVEDRAVLRIVPGETDVSGTTEFAIEGVPVRVTTTRVSPEAYDRGW